MKTIKASKDYLLLLAFVTLFSLQSSCQKATQPYKGLKNEDMKQVLQNFPNKPNRWNVPPEDGRILYDLIIENNYQKVVEIGTSNGYSSLWMGFALQQTAGKLITIEINEERAKEARKNIREAGLESVIEVRINDALEEIPKLENNIDFVFLDADKSQYATYFKMLHPKLNKGGAVSAHNVLTMNYAMRDFISAIRSDPQYTTKTYQVSRQGILVGYKNK